MPGVTAGATNTTGAPIATATTVLAIPVVGTAGGDSVSAGFACDTIGSLAAHTTVTAGAATAEDPGTGATLASDAARTTGCEAAS